MKYYIKRTNVSADGDVTILGKRLRCGKDAEPFESKSSAEGSAKRQMEQDMELCPECLINYEIIESK